MATGDEKLGALENGEQETEFNDSCTAENVAFLPKKDDDHHQVQHPEFLGLSKEELEQYANDPKWVKVRWILFAIFVIGWMVMLISAIVIVVVTPKCPPAPELAWYQSGVVYKVDPTRFQDSDGDGVGDLNGLQSRLDHLLELSVDSVWMEPLVNPSNVLEPKVVLGTIEDMTTLATIFKKKGVRLIIDLPVENANSTANLEEVIRRWATVGVEGFVLQVTDGTEDDYASLTERLSQILDLEFNKVDDRDRVIISREVLHAELPAVIHSPRNCTSESDNARGLCELRELAQIRYDEAPWKIVQLSTTKVCPACTLVKKLTIPGTANVIMGDEIGFGDGESYMKWDESANFGFSTKEGLDLGPENMAYSVLVQRSAGYNQLSLFDLFKSLAAIRESEPALLWGDMNMKDTRVGQVYVRTAKGFDPVLVALNPYDLPFAESLVFDDYNAGTVLAVSGPKLSVGDELDDLSAVFLPSEGVLVLRLKKIE